MNGLLIYATKYGSCLEISEIIAKQLNIEMKSAQDKPDCNQYDFIILGCSVYAGVFHKAMKEYINEQETILLTKKVYMFNSGLTKDEASLIKMYTENLSETMYNHLSNKQCLGGRLNFPKMGFFEKNIIKLLNKNAGFVSKEQFKENVDMIDHQAITKFIENIKK